MTETGERPTDSSPLFVQRGTTQRQLVVSGLIVGSSVLELGCGIQGGVFRFTPVEVNYLGVDKELQEDDPWHTKTDIWTFLKQGVDNNCMWDTVIALEVIEHLPPGQQEEILQQMWNVTNMRLIISTPSADASRWYPQTEWFLGTHQNPFHLREFHAYELHRELSRACNGNRGIIILPAPLDAHDNLIWLGQRPPAYLMAIVDKDI